MPNKAIESKSHAKTQAKPKLILLHGWGVNSAIWQPVVERATKDYEVHCLDLAGYGNKTASNSPKGIKELADELLDSEGDKDSKAPAHWCAWSLGGMVALHAAIDQPDRFLSLSLLCTTPKFVQSDDWPLGVDMDIFQRFADQLKADYETGIEQFLLLQAGAGPQARALATSAAKLLSQYSNPSTQTLQSGLETLRETDLRTRCETLDTNIPCQVISGKRDRVIHPNAGKLLSELLPNSSYAVLNSGHAPLLSCPDELMALLHEHINSVESGT